MTNHDAFMEEQARMTSCLHRMLMAWHEWPAGTLGRLDRFGKMELRSLGEDMVRYGQAFIAEAERQEAAARKDEAA